MQSKNWLPLRLSCSHLFLFFLLFTTVLISGVLIWQYNTNTQGMMEPEPAVGRERCGFHDVSEKWLSRAFPGQTMKPVNTWRRQMQEQRPVELLRREWYECQHHRCCSWGKIMWHITGFLNKKILLVILRGDQVVFYGCRIEESLCPAVSSCSPWPKSALSD